MKEYNCPDCERNDNCTGCPRTLQRDKDTIIEHMPPYFPDSIVWPKDYDGIPNCCKHCSNHPINGGSGICNCILPLNDPSNPWRITSTSGNTSTTTGITYVISKSSNTPL